MPRASSGSAQLEDAKAVLDIFAGKAVERITELDSRMCKHSESAHQHAQGLDAKIAAIDARVGDGLRPDAGCEQEQL